MRFLILLFVMILSCTKNLPVLKTYGVDAKYKAYIIDKISENLKIEKVHRIHITGI